MTDDLDEDDLIGEPIDDVPTREPGETCNGRRMDRDTDPITFAGYCGNTAGKRTEHVGEGRCWLHGGASPRGRDSPHFEHGLFSDHLNEEDRETMEILEQYDNADILDEMIRLETTKVRRAVEYLSDDEQSRNFWDAFDQIVTEASQGGGVTEEEIRELAGMIDSGTRAMQDKIDLVRRLVLAHNKITEGEKHVFEGETEISGSASLSVEWEETDGGESAGD